MQARNAKCKEEFSYELRKLVRSDNNFGGVHSRQGTAASVLFSSATVASSSSGDLTSTRKKKLQFSRSKSLDTRVNKSQTRSR